jgi:hypothetical protein
LQQTSSASEIGFTHHHSQYFAHFLTCEGIDEADALAQSSARIDLKTLNEFLLENQVLLRLVAAASLFSADIGKHLLWYTKERLPLHKIRSMSIEGAV